MLINCELGPLVRLGAPLQGDMSSELRTASDVRGPHTTIRSRVVYLTCQGQAGVDGVAHLGSAWAKPDTVAALDHARASPRTTSWPKLPPASSTSVGTAWSCSTCSPTVQRVRGSTSRAFLLLTTRENYDEVVGPISRHDARSGASQPTIPIR